MCHEVAKMHVVVRYLGKLLPVPLLFGRGMAALAMILGFSADSSCVLDTAFRNLEAAMLASGIHNIILS
jgi:hypothetical protein